MGLNLLAFSMGNPAELAAENEELRLANAKQQDEIRLLKEQIQVLMARSFGRSSEKFDPNQLNLFGEQKAEIAEIETQEIPGHKRKKKAGGHGRQAFPDHLPRADWVCDLADDDKVCDICEAALNAIGDDVSERGDLFPARVIVNRYIKRKYACPKGHGVKTAVAPAALLDRCKYEPSVFANIVVSKYVDHLPINRQEGILKRQGFSIPRSTMGDMIQRVVEIAGEPIIKQMKKELTEESFIQADETPITVLQEGKKGSSQGYLWIYRSEKKVLFDFRLDRKRDGPSEYLKKFSGVMQTDGYAGYNEIVARNGLIRVGCWSHARRKFNDALKSSKALSEPVMVLIGKLFAIEAELKEERDQSGLGPEEFHALRAEVRREKSSVVIEDIKAMLLDLESRPSVLPKSEFGKAVNYAMNQWSTLVAFLDHPVAELDNNAAERAIRQVALGRKNWMFAGSAKGGHAAAVLYSLVASCKVLDVNPQEYLEDVLAKVAKTPVSEIRTLTPWAWAADQQSDC